MPVEPKDEYFMKEALRLAARGRGRTSPNPMVGAVVVQGEKILGKGFHKQLGGPHAEVNALRDAGENAKGAVLYVTLEPCNHHGRTPPCTQAVLESGVSKIVAGMKDPNPSVEGGGCAYLEAKGVKVEAGVLEKECRLLNQAFIKHVTTGLTFVTLKLAATLDGRTATRGGDSRWISNERSRKFVHRLRCDLDGVLVGIGTALRDDPMLTARPRPGTACRQPVRIILDSALKLDLKSALVRTAGETPVWVACTGDAPKENEFRLSEAGVIVIRLPIADGGVDPRALFAELGKRGVASVLVEGGASVHASIIASGLADDFYFFYAPKILGDPEGVPMIGGPGGRVCESMSEAVRVHGFRVRRFGEDVMLSGRFHEEIY